MVDTTGCSKCSPNPTTSALQDSAYPAIIPRNQMLLNLLSPLPTPQDSANPAIIPRNHVMVDIIGEVETGNYEPLHKCVFFDRV